MTQAELAEAAGISQVQISRYENGRRTPRLSSARRIAAALDATVDQVFPGPDQQDPLHVLTDNIGLQP
jgi:transcriptional regulator with XRE-family HTH domain